MAELHIIGEILSAIEFPEPQLYCRWSLQSGSAWRLIEGEAEGHTHTSAHRLLERSDFSHPLDIHLAAASVQGWPKFHVEVHAVNALQQSWPVGYGFVHVPCRPGQHRLEVSCWRVAPTSWWESVKTYFGGGGVGLSKPDLVFSGVERYKLQTRSSGKVIIEVNLIFRNFAKYGVEFK